jgi:Fe-S oxidoreductase
LPDDEDAKRLSEQTFLLSEFLEKKVDNYKPPKLARKALVHGHCHQKALMGMGSDESVLSKLGLDFETVDSGCCGMAGSFGFEKEHYEVSLSVGELVLLPAVRKAADDTLIVANGFSCREQIAQTTGRQTLHLAEVIEMAMQAGAVKVRSV